MKSIKSRISLKIVVRHGERTPDVLYPKDPYSEKDFYPFRVGHLTNKGKLTNYKVGTTLRQKYNKLLGDIYTPDILYAVSSHLSRNKATLQGILAGLFTPSKELIWNKNLLWEPIPYDYLPKNENKLFSTLSTCPNWPILLAENYQKYLATDLVFQKYNYLLPFLLEKTGMTGNIYSISRVLYSTLKSEEEAGLELPEWTESIYPDILNEISSNGYKYEMMDDLKTLTPGFLISKIINNTYSTINGEIEAKNHKIHVYSAHDLNIASMLNFFDNFVPHNPNYGAHIIIEVHKYIGIYILKFLYQNNVGYLEPQPIFVPNCGIYCPLEVLVKLYAKELDPARLETLCG
ncbi:venom acid phosphatase Acph-1-like [Onthophagus taurus]|uniref:venom acid phosphatase Acph-1-like n=1 Tax=Onthophagus taurus TaxID=166361 RepID=UPI0039BDE296